jgi:hypothetical protein
MKTNQLNYNNKKHARKKKKKKKKKENKKTESSLSARNIKIEYLRLWR